MKQDTKSTRTREQGKFEVQSVEKRERGGSQCETATNSHDWRFSELFFVISQKKRGANVSTVHDY